MLDILDEMPVVNEVAGKVRTECGGAAERDVTFSYGRERILDGMSLEIEKEKIIGLVGKSGSGKSTLLKLFMRFWDVQGGSVKISGRDVAEINTSDLRDMENFMTQETHLFHDSIKNNLRIAKPDAMDAQMEAACRKASVHDFIMSLPQGYDTPMEALVFAGIFTVIIFTCYKGERKYSAASIHNYPPDIQEEYFKTHEKMDVTYKSKRVVLTKSAGVLIFTAILLVCALIAGADTFRQGFLLAFGLMAWIGIYDTCFLDWVLFANLSVFRLDGTEHMDRAYHQKWFHAKGMLFPGILFALIPAAAVGLLVMLIR